MKLFIITIILATGFLYQGALGQDRFRNFHGIDHPENGIQYFEAEGYEIFIQHVGNALNEKGIRKIKRKFRVPEARLITDPELNLAVLSDTDYKDGVTAYVNLYLIPGKDRSSTVVGFVRPAERDVELERTFMRAHLDKNIPPYVFTSFVPESIDFVGRTIELAAPCRWMSPHNLQCPNYGQMSWAIFDDIERARKHRDTFIKMARNKRLMEVKEEKWVPVKFEGKETKALRTKVKVQLPRMIVGGSNVLVIYYVVEQVRDKSVLCVLSHYTDDVGGETLPPLLAEVLELVE